jgi:hypothetical protein
MVQQSIRLGILATRMLYRENGSAKRVPCRSGYGLLSENQPVIGVTGIPSENSVDALFTAVSRKETHPAQLVSLGNWILIQDAFLPCACTTGEAELLISSGRISLLFAGPESDPGLIEICKRLSIPVIRAETSLTAEEIIQMAVAYHGTHAQTGFNPDASFVGEGQVVLSGADLERALQSTSGAKVALIGGFDTPQQSLGWIPVELTKALKGLDHQVAAWGDAALWMIKDGLSSSQQPLPVIVLDPCQGPLQAVCALAAVGEMDALSGICFTGLNRCHELAIAVGMAAIGARVCLTTPLPLWGSETVRNLLTDNLKACGGSLTHFDHPAAASEILDWFAPQ